MTKSDCQLIKCRHKDDSARKLALRLDGLPLALATAGACLSQSPGSFDQYLEAYNNSWSDLSQHSRGPIDYERKLFSTWNVSFQRVQAQDPEAAELLKLMAYLDNQDLWYEPFRKDLKNAPAWWTEVMKSRARFNRAISTLHSYSLLELNEGQCSMHMCEHDWTLEYLNHQFDQERFRIAVHCVAANVTSDQEPEYWVKNRRMLPHARRFQHFRIKAAVDWSIFEPWDMFNLAYLYKSNDMMVEAEEMYLRALREYETWGLEHISTLDTVHNLANLKSLGNLYAHQGKFAEAEKMYMRALQGYKKLGLEHEMTLNIVNCLGTIYYNQGKLAEAEKMYTRALRGFEKMCEFEHNWMLDTLFNFGILYDKLDRLTEAEEMYTRALQGYEKTLGFKHTSTLNTINNLGIVYEELGRLTEAKEMYTRALKGYEKIGGKDHPDTQMAFRNLEDVQEQLGACE